MFLITGCTSPWTLQMKPLVRGQVALPAPRIHKVTRMWSSRAGASLTWGFTQTFLDGVSRYWLRWLREAPRPFVWTAFKLPAFDPGCTAAAHVGLPLNQSYLLLRVWHGVVRLHVYLVAFPVSVCANGTGKVLVWCLRRPFLSRQLPSCVLNDGIYLRTIWARGNYGVEWVITEGFLQREVAEVQKVEQAITVKRTARHSV